MARGRGIWHLKQTPFVVMVVVPKLRSTKSTSTKFQICVRFPSFSGFLQDFSCTEPWHYLPLQLLTIFKDSSKRLYIQMWFKPDSHRWDKHKQQAQTPGIRTRRMSHLRTKPFVHVRMPRICACAYLTSVNQVLELGRDGLGTTEFKEVRV